MEVTVVVATFGDSEWKELAQQRAIPSAERLGVAVIHAHSDTLHAARNLGLTQVATEWVVHLDADDELEAGYFDAMAAVDGDLRAPSVRYVHRGQPGPPLMPRVAGHHHLCTPDCLAYGNWMVIGTLARTELLGQVGAWRDFPWSEDWDLWVRCWQAGAAIDAVPEAVYRAHVRRDSRNRAPGRAAKLAAHRAIAEANGLPIP